MWEAWRHRWRGGRDPRQARFLTLASLRWVFRHRAYTPWYLVRYARLLRFRLRNPPPPPPGALARSARLLPSRLATPPVVRRGMVFLGKRVELPARPGYGRLEI